MAAPENNSSAMRTEKGMRALHRQQGTEPLLDTFTFYAWPAAHSSSVLLETGQSELQDWEKTAEGVIRVMEGPRSCLMGMWAEWLLPPQRHQPILLFHLLPGKEKLVAYTSKGFAL